MMHNTVSIVDKMSDVICSKYGQIAAKRFISNFEQKVDPAIAITLWSRPQHEQVTLMNKYWRDTLISNPNTYSLDIREWLVECDSIIAYVSSFERVWLKMLYERSFI